MIWEFQKRMSALMILVDNFSNNFKMNPLVKARGFFLCFGFFDKGFNVDRSCRD